MTGVLSIILSAYCLLLVLFLFGWIRIRRQTMPVKGIPTKGISVIVALRNEEQNIRTLIKDLLAMAFPVGKFELIFVNDHSTDRTGELTEELIRDCPHARLLKLPEGQEGKKAALSFGIAASRFEVIVTTDADCRLSKNWLTCISTYFEEDRTKMLVGAVKFSGRSFFDRLQTTEFISLVGSTAATLGLGKPVMCNGANLSFLKRAFDEVGGYEGNLHIASGDDEFLLRKLSHRYHKGIRFLNYYEATVTSVPQKSLRDFYFQRVRWAGKWRHNSDVLTQLLAVLIIAAQLSFGGLVIVNAMGPEKSLGLLLGKLFLEAVFIYWSGRFLEKRFDIPAFLTLQIIYPLYVVVIGLFSLFAPYRWRDRNYA